MARLPQTSRLLLPLVVTSVLLLGAGCTERQPRAPFLCCVLICTGGLVDAKKEVPVNVDGGGYRCVRGEPINYEGSCSAEDVSECEDTGPGQGGGGGGGGGGDAGGMSLPDGSVMG